MLRKGYDKKVNFFIQRNGGFVTDLTIDEYKLVSREKTKQILSSESKKIYGKRPDKRKKAAGKVSMLLRYCFKIR